VASAGIGKEEMRGLRLRAGEGIAGHVFLTGESVCLEDAEQDAHFLCHRREPYRKGKVLAAPLRLGGRIAGALVISFAPASEGEAPADNGITAAPERSEGADLALLGQLAEQVGTVLARVERMRRGEAETVMAAETLKSVLVHLRRDRTSGLERVRYASAVAHTLGLGALDAARVELASLLADLALSRPEAPVADEAGPVSEADAVQKIASAPAGVLAERLERELDRQEPGAEPEDEARYRRHPEKALEILAPLECDQGIRDTILAHHEWMNGGGYPKGLAGNRIPLGARVLAVVDRFESLLLGRVGRPGVSVEEAVEDLRRLGGQRFDSRVVEALANVLEKEGRLSPPTQARPKAA